MSELILFCLGFVGAWLCLVIVTVTLYDLQTIHQEKVRRAHPHARRWRHRPYVAVHGTAPQQLHRQYRHVVTSDQPHNLVLFLRHDSTLPPTALRDAASHLYDQPKARFVELIPLQRFPTTTRQFFATYASFADLPLVKLRDVLRVRPTTGNRPFIARSPLAGTYRDHSYATLAWLLGCCNIILLLYVAYVAVAAGQYSYLAAYISMFSLWLAWAIVSHPWLNTWQKLAYIVLMPASFGYLFWRAASAPFRRLAYPVIRPWKSVTKSA